jgi:hypothetical protein
MKSKLMLATALIFSSSVIFGQEELSVKNKQGLEVLPQEGEWAFGINANPFLNYFGNLLNGTAGNNAPSFQYPNASTILNGAQGLGGGVAFMGKRMLSSTKAQRVRLQLNLFNESFSDFVFEDNLMNNQLNPTFVEDYWNSRTSSVLLGYGVEHRKGNKRLQGIYGVEGFVGYFSMRSNYNYGNEMNFQYTQPTTTNFGNNSFTANGRYYRTISETNGSSVFAGARGFVGAEFFIMPKFSIGGEIGYTAALSHTFNRSRILETFDFENLSAEQVEWKQKGVGLPRSTTFGVGLDNINVGLNFILYL